LDTKSIFLDFILKEWLLIFSIFGFFLTTIYIKHFPSYSIQEWQVLFILFVLFVVVNGLYKNGLLLKIARSIERGKFIPLKLIIGTYLLSMLVTNDVALIIIVPLTLSLNIDRKDLLIILEILAANSGSSLTPIGNPQNLYLYLFYHIPPKIFIETIAPFSLFFLLLLAIFSIFLKSQVNLSETLPVPTSKKAYIYLGSLIIVLLIVFHLLPLLMGVVILIFALLFDRDSLKIDYSLIITFFFFFGIATNLKSILASELNHSGHIFLFSLLASQIMSNVPAALLFAKFTSNWRALLWGVNAGGFGSLFASFANLIGYKLYLEHESNKIMSFTKRFLIIDYVALFLSIVLYFMLYPSGT